MLFVVYAAPWFNESALQYLEKATRLEGVQVAVLSHDPEEKLPAAIRSRLAAHWRVDDMLDSGPVAHAVGVLAAHFGPPHRLFTHQEQLQVPLAEVRARLGIPGMDVETALNFRDKVRMKTLLRDAGLPHARFRRAAREADLWDFAAEVGYPIVVKPPAGAAAQSTFRVDTPATLREALAAISFEPGQELLAEEFISGDEHSFETFSLDGRPVFRSLTHYYPSPLEVLRTPWIQWTVVLPREAGDPRYDDIRQAAFKALSVLGMKTGMSHMEWFRRRDGTLAISEVAARPPGAHFTTLISAAHDFDCMEAWLRLMIFGVFEPPERRYAAGAAYLRPQGSGRIKAIHGLEQAEREVGHLVVAGQLPQIGAQTGSSYEGEGYVILRHPQTEVIKQALLRLVNLVQIELE